MKDAQEFLIGTVDKNNFALGESLRLTFGENISFEGEESSGSLEGVVFEVESRDYIILCFSNVLSKDLMNKLNKSCVVKIKNINSLKNVLDIQIGSSGNLEYIEYTYGKQRGPFIKGMDQSWQNEVRICWEAGEDREIWCSIPAGTAELVKAVDVPEFAVNSEGAKFILEDRKRREDLYFISHRKAERRFRSSRFITALHFNTALTFMNLLFVQTSIVETLKRQVFGNMKIDITDRVWFNFFTDTLYSDNILKNRKNSIGVFIEIQPYGLGF